MEEPAEELATPRGHPLGLTLAGADVPLSRACNRTSGWASGWAVASSGCGEFRDPLSPSVFDCPGHFCAGRSFTARDVFLIWQDTGVRCVKTSETARSCGGTVSSQPPAATSMVVVLPRRPIRVTALSGRWPSATLRLEEVSVAVVLMLLRGELRSRWRAWLAGALLVALVSGLVLAGVATARRTATAFPRFEAAHGFDAFFYSAGPAPRAAALPMVTSSVELSAPTIGSVSCACGRAVNLNDFSVVEAKPAQQSRMFKVLAGRLPDQSRPDEVLASFTMQRDFGVHIGSVLHVRMASSEQRQAILENQNITPMGPEVALRVVGIEASEYEFPGNLTPSYDLYTRRGPSRASTTRRPSSLTSTSSRSATARHRYPSSRARPRRAEPSRSSTSTPSVRRSTPRSSHRRTAGGFSAVSLRWSDSSSCSRRCSAKRSSSQRSTPPCVHSAHRDASCLR